MKWIAIAGTWRDTNNQVESDVRREVAEIIKRGDGIATGGALGVDFFATDEALKLNPEANQIKIFLPATVERYTAHYRKRAQEGVITSELAETLINQLTKIKAITAMCIVEHPTNEVIDKDAYFNRITDIVNAADELVAFQVNNSAGTQDTIDKAKKKGMPVKVFSYTI
jgi:hypothetical protein